GAGASTSAAESRDSNARRIDVSFARRDDRIAGLRPMIPRRGPGGFQGFSENPTPPPPSPERRGGAYRGLAPPPRSGEGGGGWGCRAAGQRQAAKWRSMARPTR